MKDFELLPQIESPRDLRGLTNQQLLQLADEIREALCNLVQERSAHFASNSYRSSAQFCC